MSSLVDVGGYRLAFEVRGTGSPPVVFVSGLGDTGEVWDATIAALGAGTKTVSYERPGLGRSDALPTDGQAETRSYGDFAAELRRLLQASEVTSPAVIVGHSIGVLVSLAYASQWPDAVAGLVAVDATDPSLYLDVDNPEQFIRDGDDAGCATFDWVRGLTEYEHFDLQAVPAVVLSSAAGRWSSAKEPELYRPFTLAEVDDRWQAWQRRLAQQLGAILVVAPSGGHYVHTELPKLTAAAIDAVVDAARNRETIASDRIGDALRIAKQSLTHGAAGAGSSRRA